MGKEPASQTLALDRAEETSCSEEEPIREQEQMADLTEIAIEPSRYRNFCQKISCQTTYGCLGGKLKSYQNSLPHYERQMEQQEKLNLQKQQERMLLQRDML